VRKLSFSSGLASVALVAALAVAPARAASINVTSDSGSLGNFILTNLGGGNFALDLTPVPPPQLTQINGTPVLAQANFGTIVNFTVISGIGGTSYTITSATNLPKIYNSPDSVTDPTVSETYRLASGQAGSGLDMNGLILAGVVTSVLDPTFTVGANTYNFAGMLGGTTTLVLTATDYTGGATSMATVISTVGATARGSGSFSQGAVPEPTSMALLSIGLGGLLAYRRRLAKRATA